ncbi:hypothetical protein [Tepidiforma thermophila]|uniref:Lipoprotein LpqB beta-propeller domain-containing protein n=1 Tax=Tepidiforma thermophila (strain KCTC 52669 / CGMCC 1.13589 / G233) TaxID=2761530 RepID=A0A2A9HH58_TEPT2|nr:hypothetical protein [Tepidiforma thermophila]PFG74430.1 hypothetical protein A9A59_1657 [Tepidiforma thermophila]
MASTPVSPVRYRTRHQPGTGRLARLVLVLTGLVAVLAIGPILWGIIAGDAKQGPGSAFAAAPPGTYALVTRTEGSVDVIAAVRVDQPASPIEIARVPHLEGFRTRGAVDPSGRFAALVVVDGGSPVQPHASLIVVDLQRGVAERLVSGIDPLQMPLWTTTGDAVIVTRPSAAPSSGGAAVDLLEVRLDGAVRLRWSQAALALAPVGWKDGRLLAVAVDARGSTLQADGQDLLHLSTSITRDWALAPDGSAIAFVEVSTDSGVRYSARVAVLDGAVAARAQALSAPGIEALGAAWAPGGSPTFGAVPRHDVVMGDASAQSLRDAPGFDVPLGYSPDGSHLVVMHWNGSSFASPGRPELQVIGPAGRAAIPGFEGFLGWARR